MSEDKKEIAQEIINMLFASLSNEEREILDKVIKESKAKEGANK